MGRFTIEVDDNIDRLDSFVFPWRYDREGDRTLFSYRDFYLFESIFLFI